MLLSALDVALASSPGLRKGLVSHVRMGATGVLQHAAHSGKSVVKTGTARRIWTPRGPAIAVDGSSSMEVDGRVMTASSSGPLSFTMYLSLDVTGSSSKYAFGQSNSGGTIYTQLAGFTGDGTGGSTVGRQYISFGYYNSGNGRVKHCHFPDYINKSLFMFTGVMDSATSFRCYLNGNLHAATSYDYVWGAGNSIPTSRTDRWGLGQLGEFAAARMTGTFGEVLVHARALSAEEVQYIHRCFGRRRFTFPQGLTPTVSTAKPWLYRRNSCVSRPYLQVA